VDCEDNIAGRAGQQHRYTEKSEVIYLAVCQGCLHCFAQIIPLQRWRFREIVPGLIALQLKARHSAAIIELYNHAPAFSSTAGC